MHAELSISQSRIRALLFSNLSFNVVVVQKRMFNPVNFIANHGVEIYALKTLENTLFNIGIITSQGFNKLLHFLTF